MMVGALVAAPGGSVGAQAEADENLVPVSPARLLETRSGSGASTVDGDGLGGGKVQGGTAIAVQVTERGGVAPGAESAMLNVTVTEPDGLGFVTVYPCESAAEDPPLSSNLNYAMGQTIPNAVLARLGSSGKACLYTLATAHLVVDVTGYVPAGAAPIGIDPARYLETRSEPGDATFDGEGMPGATVPANGVVEFEVAGRGDVPLNAESVILNVASVDPLAPGFLTVFPCGIADPGTSNLNYGTGETRANLAQTSVGIDGKVCISSKAETHVIADVLGYLPPGGSRMAIEPARCADTRVGPQYRTFDGSFLGDGPIAGGDTYEVTVAGRCHIPDAAIAAYMNVTAVNAVGPGFLTVFPCDEARPTSSNVNYSNSNAQPNSVVSKFSLDGAGQICIYASETTDVIVDVSGYVPPPSPDFVKVAHGGTFGCGIGGDDGGLICWGHNVYDSLPGADDGEKAAVPYHVPGLGSGIVDVSLIDARGCVVRADGTATCWGWSDSGQVGDGEPSSYGYTKDDLTPVVGTSGSGALDNLEQIRTDSGHTCAVSSGGTAYCWGSGGEGQLGTGDYDATSIPGEVTMIPDDRTVLEIAPGRSSTCALLDDASVLCWGSDLYDSLGDGDDDNGGVVMTDAAATEPLADVTDIDASSSGYCAVRADGTVWCWGRNDYGRLGDGTTDRRTYAVQVNGIDDAVEASGGGRNNCALRADGTVTCWGWTRSWGPSFSEDDAPRFFEIDFGEPFIGIDTRSDETGCWLTETGWAACAGWNFHNHAGYPTVSGGGQRDPGYVQTWLAG